MSGKQLTNQRKIIFKKKNSVDRNHQLNIISQIKGKISQVYRDLQVNISQIKENKCLKNLKSPVSVRTKSQVDRNRQVNILQIKEKIFREFHKSEFVGTFWYALNQRKNNSLIIHNCLVYRV